MLSKFVRRINLMTLLVTILGSRNQENYLEFRNLTFLGYLSYKFRLRKVKILSFVEQIPP
jgi:hypothetical protein